MDRIQLITTVIETGLASAIAKQHKAWLETEEDQRCRFLCFISLDL